MGALGGVSLQEAVQHGIYNLGDFSSNGYGVNLETRLLT